MESYFINLFQDVRHERSLILLLSITDEGTLKQDGFADSEIEIFKTLLFKNLATS